MCVCVPGYLSGVSVLLFVIQCRDTLLGLCCLYGYTIFQSSGGATWPLLSCLWLRFSLQLPVCYRPSHTTQSCSCEPSLCDSPLLSKAHVLAAGLQDLEWLQALLVFLSQRSPPTSWPLAIAERLGEYSGEITDLSCEEWLRKSAWRVPKSLLSEKQYPVSIWTGETLPLRVPCPAH